MSNVSKDFRFDLGTLAQETVSKAVTKRPREEGKADSFMATVGRDATRGARFLSLIPRSIGATLAGGIAHPGQATTQAGFINGVSDAAGNAVHGIGSALGSMIGAAVGVLHAPFSDDDIGTTIRNDSQGVGSGIGDLGRAVTQLVGSLFSEVARLGVAVVSGAVGVVGCVAGASVGILHAGINSMSGRKGTAAVTPQQLEDSKALTLAMKDPTALEACRVKDESELEGKSEAVAEKSEAVAEKSEAVAEKSEVAAEKTEVAAEKTEVAAEKTEVAAEKTEVAAEKTEVAAEKTEVAAEKTEVAAEKTEVAAEKTEVAAEKTEVAAEKTEVAAEKTEVAAEKTEVAAEPEVADKA